MKIGIHPNYNLETKVTCNCGAIFHTGSTKNSIHVEVCSSCHPLYTGEKRFIDKLGTVERFKSRQVAAASYVKKDKNKKSDKTTDSKSMSLKDLLAGYSA